jgi:RHS repeat-associated protein
VPSTALVAGSDTVFAWIEEIRQVWSRGTGHALELARLIGRARNHLFHGEWSQVVKSLPFSKRKADMLVSISQGMAWLSEQTFAHLPIGWSILYQLAQLKRPVFEKLLEEGEIHPKLTLKEARELVARFNGRRKKKSSGINIQRRLRQFCAFVESTLNQWKPADCKLAKRKLSDLLAQIDPAGCNAAAPDLNRSPKHRFSRPQRIVHPSRSHRCSFKSRKTMKCRSRIALAVLSFSAGALAQGVVGVGTEPQITERGPHHRVIERMVGGRKSSYTEIATGLHYWKDGQWLDSKEEIEIFQGAAMARQGQHQVIFAANLNSPGSIDMVDSSGKRFRSHVLGIAYTDYASGQSVLIAEMKDCVGAVLPPNQVIYQDAFDGDCVADVRYTYTTAGFEQDVILLTAPPSPAFFGLNPATTRLEVWTEFIELPEGTMTPVILKQENDPVARQQMVEPDLIDHRLDFGVMKFEQGQAFPLSDGGPFSEAALPTGKSMERIDGRVFLIEKVDHEDIHAQLQQLPQQAVANPRRNVINASDGRALFARTLPAPKGERGVWKERLVARVAPNRKGLVMDYITLNGSITNYVLKADTTYYVNTNQTVNFYGATVIEGGTVVKFAAGTTRLQILGTTDCRTDLYRPAFFVSRDDNTVGGVIENSSGAPSTNRYALAAVHLATSGTSHALQHLRFRNAVRALWVTTGTASFTLEHSQFGFSDYPIYSQNTGLSPVRGRNLLVHDGLVGFHASSASSSNWLEHLTVHRTKYFQSGSGTIFLTNSLLISVTNALTYAGANNVTNLDDTGFFQTIGAGAHYLANSSTNRNAGTTNINPDLLAALGKKTTYPPVIISTNITGNTTLTAQAGRDTDTPDIGYHYEPIDFVVSQVALTNATLTLQVGTALGVYGSNSQPGLVLLNGGKVLSTGSPDNLNRVVRYNLVQEQADATWSATTVGRSITTVSPYGTNLLASEASFRFTDFSMPANGNDHIYVGATNLTFTLQDSQFHGGSFTAVQPDVTLLNNLFNRVAFKLYANIRPFAALVRNATFFGGTVTLSNAVSGGWNFRDNLFDTTNLVQVGFVTNNYNAYLTNSIRLTNNGADILLTVTNIVYDAGWLGRFYLPTNLTSHSVLFDSGSQNATNSGLYHFTTVSNQTRELTSIVDIGFHSVAVNSNGQPIDTDEDGLANYLEDANGNGLSDGSETSFLNPVLIIASPLTYIKGGPAKRLDTNAVAYDTDSVNFNSGQLTVTITSGAEANDLLAIRNEGTGAGQIGATSSAISYGGTTVATYTGGSGTNALVISFNANAVNASVQALARNLTFQSISNTPANSNRVLNFTLTDGRGGTNAPVSQTINLICPAAIDAMIVIDISQSLEPAEFDQAKQAASNFVTHLNFSTDRVGLVSFAGDAYLNSVLTNNGAHVQSNILSLITNGGTRFQPPLDTARTNMSQVASNTLPLMLLLSDGKSGGPGVLFDNRVAATNAALAVKEAGIRLIAVAYGNEGDENGGTNLMKWFASSPNDFYHSPTISQIDSNFSVIADGICRGFSLVSITNPANNPTTFVAPSSITLGASASDSEGVAKVEFYNFGTNKIGEDASSPYSIDWLNPTVGTNQLTARALDNLGISTTSAVVIVIVHSPPSISIVAPTNAAGFAQVMNLLVRSSAVDVDGWITNVQFFTNSGTTPFKTVTNPPFQFAWTNLSNNTYTVQAIAWDNNGYTGTSAPVAFDVHSCSEVSVSSLTFSTNTIVGGSNVTATITLNGNAPAGGQVVALFCSDPNVSIPASVLVPANTNKVTFTIYTYTLTDTVSAAIIATAVNSVTNSLSVTGKGFQTARYAKECGPMDVVFLTDISGNSHLSSVKTNVSSIIDAIQFASGGDYRLALLSFDSNIYVNLQFTATNWAAFSNAFSSLTATTQIYPSEPSDEALNTAINSLSSVGREDRQFGDFTNGFRLEARRLIVLITGEPPYGFTGPQETVEWGIDDVNAHARAVEASLKNIQISAIRTRSNEEAEGPSTASIPFMQDYAFTTGGQYHATELGNGDLHLLLLSVLSQCGAELGEIVTIRDDLRQWNHTAINLNNSRQQATSLDPASFDLSGVDGPVMAAQFQRTGQWRINNGSHFDLSLGVASMANTNLAFFAAPEQSAQTNLLGVPYATQWNLPFPFFTDIQQKLGTIYSVDLVDRASTVCGNQFDVTDTPQSDWPGARNTLTFKSLSRFEIAQGRCRDFALTGTNVPCLTTTAFCGGLADPLWEIRLYDEVIATPCSPHGWSVESDHGVYGGVNVCSPADALTANRYEVRFLEGGTDARSGYFSVVPAGYLASAPVLKPLEISLTTCSGNTPVTVSVLLDAPAQEPEAFVSLRVTGITNTDIPPFVRIPMGQTTASFTFRPTPISNDTPFEITATYNGSRKMSGQVIEETFLDAPTIDARSDTERIVLSWEAIPGALYYNVERTSDSVILARGLSTPCYTDENPTHGNNCYEVTAVNSIETYSSFETCQYYTNSIPLRPRITPHGGRFNDFAPVTITCETPNVEIYYSTNGIPPGPGNVDSILYTEPFNLPFSTQVFATATYFLSGIWSPDDRADFHVSQPNSIQCGDTIVSVLASTNQPSVVKGVGWYGARYSFIGRRGDAVKIDVLSQDFDADLNLRDPNKVVVVQNDISLTTGLGIRPGIAHTLRTNGLYVFEVTSANQFATGNFSVRLQCFPGPELDVFQGTTELTNTSTLDFGITLLTNAVQRTITLTNSGSANLTIQNLTVSPASLFSINLSNSMSLATNNATNIIITFNAISNGPWTGVLSFNHNDDFDDLPEGFELDDPFVIYLDAFANPLGTAPTVNLTNLSNGQVLTTPPTLTIGADASATGASVTQVVFYATGSASKTILGVVASSPPWSVPWSDASGGNYTLRALAKDNAGRGAFSAPTNIVINNPPVAVADRLSAFKNSTNNLLSVLANDSDPNGHGIILSNLPAPGPSQGTASISGSAILYTPTSGYTGHDSFSYVIVDSLGATNGGTVSIAIFPEFGEWNDPVATIATPTNNIEIVDAIAITGTASHQFLHFWQLQSRRRGSAPTPWKTFAEGTSSITNGTLGTFNPTGLPNGIYQIRLKVVDFSGTAAEDTVTIRIGESPKIGHFTLAFTDLQIPVSGLPITLTRTYDSRNTDQGDFGAGWNLDVSSVRLEKSGIMGEGWATATGQGIGALYHCVVETESHLVTITFPDDKVYRFQAVVSLNNKTNDNCTIAGAMGLAEGAISYAPLPGTVGALRELGSNTLLKIGFIDTNHPVTFHDARENHSEWANTNFFGPVYDPREFEFTTLDGRKFQFNEAGKVVKMTDRVGNSLTFGSDGIVHTSGKSVKFVRDAGGRITEIYDPNGLNSSNQPSGHPAVQFKYDGAGNLISTHRLTDRNATNPAYVTTQFAYTNTSYPHYLTSIVDPRGVTGIRNEYADDGKLKSTTDASGKTITFTHNVSGKTETIVDRLGNTNIFKYDAKGNITAITNALGQVNTYDFDANNNKTGEIIAGLLTNSFAFDANNLLTESVAGGLITNKFTYNQFGQVLAALDGLGRGTTNFYDAVGNLLATTNALGFTNGFTYDTGGNLLTLKDALGVVTTHHYDQYGNLTNAATGSAAPSAFTYDDNGNRLTEVQLTPGTLVPLVTNTFVYDAQNRVIARVDSLGNSNRTEYNELGRHEEVIDALGRTNRYEYDLRGNLSLVTYPDQTTEQYGYDAEGRRTNSVDRAGRSTSFVFDALGRLTQTFYPDNTSTRTIYDAAGRVQFTVDARGFTNAFGYDSAGRRVASTNAWGTAVAQWSTNAFDAGGNLIASGDAAGRVTRYTYDALNQRTQMLLPDNTTLTTLYNGAGQRVGEVDAAGITNRFGYDPDLGTLQAVTNAWATPSAMWATYAFDSLGRRTNQIDALGRRTAYEFDTDGRRLRRVLPGSQWEGSTYDAAGNLLRQTNFNGQIITNLYDSQSRLLSRWHGGTQLVAYTYNLTGQRATMSDEAGVTTFAYDKRDRLITNASPVGTLIYAYDENGNLTNMVSSTPEGVSIGYQYDALNRLTNAVDNRLTGTKNTGYRFDDVGNLTALTYPNGVTNLWQYDTLNRLTNLVWKLNSTTNAAFAYQLGAAGNRTRLDETVNASNRVYQWSYDSLYRLKNEIITGAGSTGAIAYAHDPVGNRTNRASTLAALTNQVFGYNTNDWLTIDTFDSAGNTRTNAGNVFLYDWANRLTNAVIGTTNVSIVYNADGQRVKKTVVFSTTTNITLYLVDSRNPSGYAQVMEELSVSSGSTNVVRAYTHGLDLISQRVPGSSTNFFGVDGLGSTRMLLNLAGGVSDTYTYDAFGTVIASTGTTTNHYLYAGEQRDADLGGLYYLRAPRYLNTGTGRFTTMDSFEGTSTEPLSLHKYLYAHADPVNRIDPSGHEVQHAARDLNTRASLGGGKHQFLLLIPDNPADFQGTSAGATLLNALPNATMRNIGGKQVIVVGVHSVSGRAQAKFFEPADVTATRELIDPNYELPFWSDFDAEAYVIPAPSGKTDTQFITDILKAVENYISNENIANIPYPTAGGAGQERSKTTYNSNSWATSLLRYVGAEPHRDFKGYDALWDHRIPDEFFKTGGVKPGAKPPPGSRLNISNTLNLNTNVILP